MGGSDVSVQYHKHPYNHKPTKMSSHKSPSLNHMASSGEATPKEAMLNGTPAPAAAARHTLADRASSSMKRKDKQIMMVEKTGEKALARDLGRRTGEFICIDNNARGDIYDKILYARVLVPLGCPLLRGIPIEDEFTDEEVMVSLCYERLPTFSLFCGLIGHSKQSCNRPETPKTSRVEMLSMQDNDAANKNTNGTLMINDATTNANTLTKNPNDDSLAKIVINSHTSSDSSSTPGLEPPEPLGASPMPAVAMPTAKVLPPTSPNTKNAHNIAKTKPDKAPAIKDSGKTAVSAANAPTGDHATCKRRPREEIKARIQGTGEHATQGFTLGATRQREEEDSTALSPVQNKKIVMQVPSMVDCLGEEGLRKLMELEDASDARASFGTLLYT
ncbi:hypothetical protein ACQ4PT_019869 [Festuca glaucescens]